jgi:hypothetical protein
VAELEPEWLWQQVAHEPRPIGLWRRTDFTSEPRDAVKMVKGLPQARCCPATSSCDYPRRSD